MARFMARKADIQFIKKKENPNRNDESIELKHFRPYMGSGNIFGVILMKSNGPKI